MRVHGTSGGRERRRERRFGGSSSLFRPTTGTPTGCELFAGDDAALIHGVKVEPMLKHYLRRYNLQHVESRRHQSHEDARESSGVVVVIEHQFLRRWRCRRRRRSWWW